MRGGPHSAALTHHVNTITHFVLSQPLLAASHQQLATVPDRPRRARRLATTCRAEHAGSLQHAAPERMRRAAVRWSARLLGLAVPWGLGKAATMQRGANWRVRSAVVAHGWLQVEEKIDRLLEQTGVADAGRKPGCMLNPISLGSVR